MHVHRVWIRLAKHIAHDGAHRAFHIWAGHLVDDVFQAHVDATGFQIRWEVFQGFVQGHHEGHLVVQVEHIGVHIHHDHTGRGQLVFGLHHHRLQVRRQTGPELGRHAHAHTFQIGRSRHRCASDGGVQERHISHGFAHGTDRVTRVADWHHGVVVVVATLFAAIAHRRTKAHDATQGSGHAGRTTGVCAQAARHHAHRNGHSRATR